MKTLNRREFLQLAAGLSAAVASGGLFRPAEATTSAPVASAVLDYTRAKAIPTICFGCTNHCGVIGWVQDGKARLLEGNHLDPNSRGAICSKANSLVSLTYYPERILYPLKRVGKRGEGRWKRISWDEALDEIATKMKALRDAGTPEQFVFHYGRDKTKGFTKRFTNAFGTPHRLNRRSICSSNRRAPLMSYYGREFEWETQDFANSRFILNFGGNPMEAYQGGLFMVGRIVDARMNGAKMVTFEVRPSATASVSDEYFTIYPATDGLVALAMANVIVNEDLADADFWNRWATVSFDKIKEHLQPFTPEMAAEQSGIPADDIKRLAREFAQAAPHCTTMSNRGSAKHYNGVASDRAIRMLDVLVGNVGRPGGFCLSTLRMWKNRYGQEGLPVISQPKPSPKGPKPWKPGTKEFAALPKDVQKRVAEFPEDWANRYFGELATPSEYPLAWHWYQMRVGQLVYPYIREGRQKVGVYMSYTLGASYGYPEANVARDVLMDEELIPFHVAIDISYGEQAALADIILPDATGLERWDAHSTNSYGLIPYTGIRQPLVEPLGEARPAQIILRDLARRIGGGMEQYFDFEDLESYYKAWYKNVPMDWEEFKRRGIWQDAERQPDYELYERPVPEEELKDASVDPETGVITTSQGGKTKKIGIIIDGKAVRGFPTPTRKIQVFDPIFPLAAKHTGLSMDDVNASPLPTWGPVPEHEGMGPDDYHLTTFKWNVHTQGRTAHSKYQAEIVHTNQAFISPNLAKKFDLKDGDWVEITVFRPAANTYRAGEEDPVGQFRNRVKILPGVHDRVIACSHHAGHWEHGKVARADADASHGAPGMDPGLTGADADIPGRIWWSKDNGGVGNGIPLNDNLPINPTPLVGGQSWFDNVCRIRKV